MKLVPPSAHFTQSVDKKIRDWSRVFTRCITLVLHFTLFLFTLPVRRPARVFMMLFHLFIYEWHPARASSPPPLFSPSALLVFLPALSPQLLL